VLPDLQPLVAELVAEGAQVVWLAGSYARGEPGPYSDLDVGVLAGERLRGPRAFRLYHDVLTSIVWTTPESTRASFRDPAQVGGAIPGWREPLLLHDPDSVGASIRDEARAWTWDVAASRCDDWIAAQLTQLAEEVHKLLNALEAGHETNIAVRRNVLLQRLPLVMSVHRRLLYDSERRLWDVVAGAVGSEWIRHQAAASAPGDVALAASAASALALYRITATEASSVLRDEQRDVVKHTLSLFKH
jgi:predicted nucleotidyltransferase